MADIIDASHANRLLVALSEQLGALGESHELVVVGGSALVALGIISRATKDVDLVALRSEAGLVSAEPLPASLVTAADRVARDFGLPDEWLNSGPTGLLDFGLPLGFEERLEIRSYGAGLTVHFAARFDQIHFKLYALVDQGAGKHGSDLRALNPTRNELISAARWTRTHDPSPGYEQSLVEALRYLGVENADLRA